MPPSFSAHLAVSPPVTGALSFGGSALSWLETLAYGQIDTDEKRAAIAGHVMDVYDATGVALGKKNAFVGAAFGAMRPTIESMVIGALKALAAALGPTPTPATVTTGATQGSAAP